MATEVYNWVQKYDADLDNRQVSKKKKKKNTNWSTSTGVFTASGDVAHVSHSFGCHSFRDSTKPKKSFYEAQIYHD